MPANAGQAFNRVEITWQDVRVMPDCACAALGDTRFIDDSRWIGEGLPCACTDEGGYGMVYADAACDGLPVEIGVLEARIVAARLEFTCDVGELEAAGEGHWLSLGSIRIGNDGALALDKKHQHLDGWNHRLDLAAGMYRAESFDWDGDCLGIRLVAEGVGP